MRKFCGLNLNRIRAMIQKCCKKPITTTTIINVDGSYSHQEIVVYDKSSELNLVIVKLAQAKKCKNTPRIKVYYDECFNGSTYRHNILV